MRSVMNLVVGLAACRAGDLAVADCPHYPVSWSPAATIGEAAAAAELAELAPRAVLGWSPTRNTPSSIAPLDLPLPGCTDGVDAHTQLRAFLAAHSTLFQVDVAEWRTPASFDCKLVGPDPQVLQMGRARIADHPSHEDELAFSLRRVDGVVTLVRFSGSYLPAAAAGLDGTLDACSRLTEPQAQATARMTALPAVVLDDCITSRGRFDYQMKPNDSASLEPDDVWFWVEDAETQLVGARTLRVTVHPDNYTADLMASNARCPVPGGDATSFTIGFRIVFDVYDGHVLFVHPGLDCITCQPL
jgi:hypothetical protein